MQEVDPSNLFVGAEPIEFEIDRVIAEQKSHERSLRLKTVAGTVIGAAIGISWATWQHHRQNS